MIKRPIHNRFNEAVLAGIKTTTIRDTAWPIGKPIMLYNWEGRAYHSPHIDVAPVVVFSAQPITISHFTHGVMVYEPNWIDGQPLYETEGFGSQEQMDEWFRKVVPKNGTALKFLMRFKLHKSP